MERNSRDAIDQLSEDSDRPVRTVTKGADLAGERRRDVRRRMYRELILEAAESVFGRTPFADAKMQDVALEAGISLKTLYANFRSKAELFGELARMRCEQASRIGRAVRDQPGTATELLMRSVESGVRFLIAHPDFLRIHLRSGNAWALDPGVGTVGRRDWQESVRINAEIFRRGVAEGEFVDENPEVMAKMLTAVSQVYLADWLERGGADPEAVIERVQGYIRRAVIA